jgi:hypothetical protein
MASNGYSSNPVDTINGIKDEVLSQITKAQQIIDSFQELSNQDSIKKDIINQNETKKWQETLKGEHNKVKDLQYKLAFTGVMNAGKSMILNAIIGARILPMRDTPMTTLPTVITHKPKQTQPRLYISDVESYNEAIVQIKQKWSAIEKSKSQSEFNITSDLKETLDNLQKIDRILKEYCGESKVYNALLILSDIVRLCTILKLDNPLEKYKSIEQFPRIEIEFSFLKNRYLDNPGVLSLIDSPGFNEVGQSNLDEIVKKVLSDSSATVCVLDSTQFKAWAEKKIKESVQETQDYASSRLFVLINKFDQKTEGLDENGAIQYVTEQLFPDREIENETLSVKNKVFPVSGKKAFFANMAIRAMNQGGLPLPDKADWVRVFADLAYGEYFAERTLKDLSSEEHTKAGNELWAKSQIEKPLELIIEASLKEAAPECLRIVLIGVQDIIKQLNNSIKAFNQALKKHKNDLEEISARQSSRLSQIKNSKKELNSTKEQMLGDLNRQTTDIVKLWKENVIQEIDKWYSSTTSIVSKPKGSFFDYDLEEIRPENKEIICNSLEEKHFSTEEEANNYSSKVVNIISYILEKQLLERIDRINQIVWDSQQNLETKVKEKIKPIIEEEKKEFDIKEDILTPTFVKFEFYFSKIKTSAIKKKQRDVESYDIEYKHILVFFKIPVPKKPPKKEDYYIVAPEDFRTAIKNAVNENSREIHQQISKYISEKFKIYLERFFDNLDVVLKNFSSAINSSLELKNKSIKVQDDAGDRGYLIENDVNKLVKRNTDTREGLNEFIRSI